jgi:hypothetical protein
MQIIILLHQNDLPRPYDYQQKKPVGSPSHEESRRASLVCLQAPVVNHQARCLSQLKRAREVASAAFRCKPGVYPEAGLIVYNPSAAQGARCQYECSSHRQDSEYTYLILIGMQPYCQGRNRMAESLIRIKVFQMQARGIMISEPNDRLMYG